MGKDKGSQAAGFDATREIAALLDYVSALSTEALCRYMLNLTLIQDGALVASRTRSAIALSADLVRDRKLSGDHA